MQSGGRVGKAALLRLPARPSAPPSPAGHHPCPAAGGVVSGVPLPPDLPATFLRGWVRGFGAGEGVLSAPPPHPTLLCPWRRPRLPSPRPRTSRRGSSGRVSRAVRRDGWRLPAAGPLACPSPPAAGPRLVCSGPAARSPGASPRPRSLGALSPPRLPRLSVRFSLPLAPLPLSCPLPAWRHASRRSPLSALGGGGAGGRVPGNAGMGRGPGSWGRGRGPGRPAVRVCEVSGGGLCSVPGERGGGRLASAGMGGGRLSHGGAPMRHGLAAPRPEGWDAVVGGRRRGGGLWGAPCPSPASHFPGT